jgi:hypothetical protein
MRTLLEKSNANGKEDLFEVGLSNFSATENFGGARYQWEMTVENYRVQRKQPNMITIKLPR